MMWPSESTFQVAASLYHRPIFIQPFKAEDISLAVLELSVCSLP